MNDPFDEDFSDEELSAAFAVETTEPSVEHFEQLRRQVALLTKPTQADPQPIPVVAPRYPRNFSRFRLAVAFVVAVGIAILVTIPFVENATAGLLSTLEATRTARWIHGSTTFEQAGKTVVTESWCNPSERVVAFKSSQILNVVNYQLGLQTSYSSELGQVYQWQADLHSEGWGRAFVNALLNDGDIKSNYPFHEVSDVQKSVSNIDGESTITYSFRVQWKNDPSIGWETVVRTDSKSGRIFSWQENHSGGMRVTTLFDYPDQGPRDIYELGAPSDAHVVQLSELIGTL